jgi:hypothetical protein
MRLTRTISLCRLMLTIAIALAASLATPSTALAHVVRVVIDKREPIAAGASFGAVGAYERLTGRVYFAFDPANPHDRQIVDLSRAPRNAEGEVEAWAEFVMLRPVDPSRGSGVTLLDVVNRGGMTVGVFHLGANRELSPDSAAFYGDALLLRRGMTVVMLGWQWDILPDAPGLHFHAPVASDGAHPITGLVRSDITVDAQTHSIPLGHLVGGSKALAYPVSDTADRENRLTVRDGPLAPRRVIARKLWRFAREDSSGAVVDDPRSVYMSAGFDAGKIYEVIYRAKDPVVVGTGLAAVRDMMSYLKYDSASIAPTRFGIAYGVSQTGRFLRHFLYQNFNVDERGRRAFDGIFAHTAGAGRGSFNHRFAQPSRDAQPYSTFFYPTDLFPFTTVGERDPVSGRHDGLRVHSAGDSSAAASPKVFYVDGGYEYWGRAASLTHTSVDGVRDVGFLRSERRYVISSAQHSSPARFPPAEGARMASGAAYRGDPLDQRLALRALLVALIDWVKEGREPPASRYPTIAGGSLVPVDSARRPQIPGVALARIPYQPYRVDLGARWTAGILDREPPGIGAPYVVRVSQVDSIGNDLGGIRSVEARVPLATYFPWQLRTGAASDRLVSFAGTFVPLPRTEAERTSAHDPRPSVERLYGSRDVFLSRMDSAAAELVAERFLLAEDVSAARTRMAATWDWVEALPAR